MRYFTLALFCAATLTACAQTSQNTASNGLPNPFRLVGEPGLGAIATAELAGDGIIVSTDFVGRRLGITAFCSGNAEAVVMDGGFTPEERLVCKGLGGSWSALGTEKGAGVYVRPDLARALLDAAPNTF